MRDVKSVVGGGKEGSVGIGVVCCDGHRLSGRADGRTNKSFIKHEEKKAEGGRRGRFMRRLKISC